jgi:hypothetical protein
MLELTENQIQQLRQHEHAGFVARVHSELLTQFPDLAAEQGLDARLMAAHVAALEFGLESAQARTQFLYQEAFAPEFYKQAAIAAWITRPGAEPEQRWRDFMALVKARLAPDESKEQ